MNNDPISLLPGRAMTAGPARATPPIPDRPVEGVFHSLTPDGRPRFSIPTFDRYTLWEGRWHNPSVVPDPDSAVLVVFTDRNLPWVIAAESTAAAATAGYAASTHRMNPQVSGDNDSIVDLQLIPINLLDDYTSMDHGEGGAALAFEWHTDGVKVLVDGFYSAMLKIRVQGLQAGWYLLPSMGDWEAMANPNQQLEGGTGPDTHATITLPSMFVAAGRMLNTYCLFGGSGATTPKPWLTQFELTVVRLPLT